MPDPGSPPHFRTPVESAEASPSAASPPLERLPRARRDEEADAREPQAAIEADAQSGTPAADGSHDPLAVDLPPDPRLRADRRRSLGPRSLLFQVLATNLLLVAAALVFATIALTARGGGFGGGASAHMRALLIFALATLAAVLGNWLLLRRRFAPLERLIEAMERAALAQPQPMPAPVGGSDELRRLYGAFARMMLRLERERRAVGLAAIEAQERERRRIAQDLHDEVNQALTAVSLRLQASIERSPPELRRELIETKRLSVRAMKELLELARQLRPAVLDDHGLLAALHSQVAEFTERTGIEATFAAYGPMPPLSSSQQLAIYRIVQESLSNVARHAGARRVRVELSFVGRTILRVSDDGHGFDHAGRPGSLGLPGMRERALLAGGRLAIHTARGRGTRVELTIE